MTIYLDDAFVGRRRCGGGGSAGCWRRRRLNFALGRVQLAQIGGKVALVHHQVEGDFAPDVRRRALTQIGDAPHGDFVIPANSFNLISIH